MFIKLVKYFKQRNVMVLFESSSQATWSRHLKSWRGGFAKIPRDIMTHKDLKDFRIDFGLDSPDLPETPTIMELLGKLSYTEKTYLNYYDKIINEIKVMIKSSCQPTDMPPAGKILHICPKKDQDT